MTEQNTPKMTHNEMIDALKGLVFGTFDRTTAIEREALNMAIKALEFRDDVLDKIEKEISNLKGTFPSEYYLKIIDKYKAESEDK